MSPTSRQGVKSTSRRCVWVVTDYDRDERAVCRLTSATFVWRQISPGRVSDRQAVARSPSSPRCSRSLQEFTQQGRALSIGNDSVEQSIEGRSDESPAKAEDLRGGGCRGRQTASRKGNKRAEQLLQHGLLAIQRRGDVYWGVESKLEVIYIYTSPCPVDVFSSCYPLAISRFSCRVFHFIPLPHGLLWAYSIVIGRFR